VAYAIKSSANKEEIFVFNFQIVTVAV